MVTSSPPQQSGGTTGVDSPATPEQERPRRRQPSAARSRTNRDTSLTQFAVMDDENVSQQVRAFKLFVASFLDGTRGSLKHQRWDFFKFYLTRFFIVLKQETTENNY